MVDENADFFDLVDIDLENMLKKVDILNYRY